MTQQEVYAFVKANGSGTYDLISENGSTWERVRLFISTRDVLCEFLPRSRTKGRPFKAGEEYTSIKKVTGLKKDKYVTVRDNLKKIVKYTTASGLWESIKTTAEHYLSLDDETFKQVVGYECWDDLIKYEQTHGLTHFTDGGLLALSSPRMIKKINYNCYDREAVSRDFAKAISEKGSYNHFWRKGYDNRVSCELAANGEMKGWYSEEYRNCGNGHYYIALDSTHALFYEND